MYIPPIMPYINLNLLAAMAQSGFHSQSELGRRLNIPLTTLNGVLRGVRPGHRVRRRIAKVLNVNLNDLVPLHPKSRRPRVKS